jgi:hypothetical protein
MNTKRRSQRPKARITSAGWKPPRASIVSGSVASVLPGQRGAQRLPMVHVHFGRVNASTRRQFVRLCERENVYCSKLVDATWRDDIQRSAEVWEVIGHSGNLSAIAQWIDGIAYVRMTLPVAGGTPFIAAGSGGTESAGASKAIRRVTMPKREREARYARETHEYRQSVRDSDKLRAIVAILRDDELAQAWPVDADGKRILPAFVPQNGELPAYDCTPLPDVSPKISAMAHTYGYIDALRYWKLMEHCEQSRRGAEFYR